MRIFFCFRQIKTICRTKNYKEQALRFIKMTIQQMLSPLRRAIDDYSMINDGDKIAVGLSGGKDSMTLLVTLNALRRFYPKKFTLVAVTIDLGLSGSNENELSAITKYCNEIGVEHYIERTDIGKIIFEERKEKNPCSLCSKMRRGALNTAAINLGCNKIALGHHRDDLMETLFLSLFYEGRLSTFSPVTYLSRTDVTVIRPMIYIEEKNIAAFSKDLPKYKNVCPADKHTQRQYVKNLIDGIKADIPFVKDRISSAITHPERNNLFPPKSRTEQPEQNTSDGESDL